MSSFAHTKYFENRRCALT